MTRPQHTAWLLGAAVVIAGIIAAVALLPQSEPRMNLLFITLDTLRADHLGAYGYPGLISPNLDRLAARSVVFERASSTAPSTAPSHTSMFTSQHPSAHGIVFNGNRHPEKISRRYPTLAEQLQKAGFVTAAFVSTGCLFRKYGFARGFDEFLELRKKKNIYTSPSGKKESGCWGKITTEKVVEYLEHHKNDRFFVWAHYFDVHLPYMSPPEISKKLGIPYGELRKKQLAQNRELTRAAYRAEVYETDGYVGDLLDAVEDLGLSDSTIIAAVADHGEYLGEHGLYHHHQLYEEVLQVPMIIHRPGQRTGVRRKDSVSTIDLAPTLLAMLGCPPLPLAKGRDLFAEDAARQVVPSFAEWRNYKILAKFKKPPKPHFFQISTRVNRKKLIRSIVSPDLQMVFDLDEDPGETRNLQSLSPALSEHLSEVLDGHIRTDLPNGVIGAQNIDLDAQTVEMLKALGYIQAD